MFTLDQVMPWGRSFDEYRRMFALTDADLALRIVGCGDGPAGFNAEATRHGGRVVSCDPIYKWDTARLEERITATCETIMAQTRFNAEEFVWGEGIGSVEELGQPCFTVDEKAIRCSNLRGMRSASSSTGSSLSPPPRAARLSDAEHQMLSFSESDPQFVVDPALVRRLEAEISDEEYERKVTGVVRRSYEEDLARDSGARGTYQEARAVLMQAITMSS